jgi:hypothetical protein
MKKSELKAIIREEAQSLMKERYTEEGYVEMMGPEFDQAAKMIEKAWYNWKSAPMTSPKDKLPAKQDLLNYFNMILD